MIFAEFKWLDRMLIKQCSDKFVIAFICVFLIILCTGILMRNDHIAAIGFYSIIVGTIVGGIGYGTKRAKVVSFCIAGVLLLIVWQLYEIQGAQYRAEVRALNIELRSMRHQLDLQQHSNSVLFKSVTNPTMSGQ